MAKTNIKFNNTDYFIDESSLAAATAELKAHLSTVMSGAGATINLCGTSYNVDSAKLSTATNTFITHLGTVAGSGSKVVVNGVTYNVDSTKMSGAVADLETVLDGLNAGGDEGGSGSDAPEFNPELNPIGTIPEGAYYVNFDTVTIYSEMPATVSEGDMYLYGDYVYAYQPSYDGWAVVLATEELGITNYIPTYPITDRNQTSYGAILESINGKPVVVLFEIFEDCQYMTSIPSIPCSVVELAATFRGCTSLTSVVIPDSVTSISSLTFSSCSGLTSIVIPASVTRIGSSAFNGCSALTSVVIPNGVTSISDGVFTQCYSLTSIVIPDGITFIGNGAFAECESLTTITFEGTQAQWNAIGKGELWNFGTGNYTVYCTDGNITKDPN